MVQIQIPGVIPVVQKVKVKKEKTIKCKGCGRFIGSPVRVADELYGSGCAKKARIEKALREEKEYREEAAATFQAEIEAKITKKLALVITLDQYLNSLKASELMQITNFSNFLVSTVDFYIRDEFENLLANNLIPLPIFPGKDSPDLLRQYLLDLDMIDFQTDGRLKCFMIEKIESTNDLYTDILVAHQTSLSVLPEKVGV